MTTNPRFLLWLAYLALGLPMTPSLAQLADEGANACADRMTRTFVEKGWVGITPRYDDDGLIIVEHVFANSPAENAGIRKGDIVHGLNGMDRKSSADGFRKAYDSIRPNETTVFEIERDGTRLSISVLVEPIPEAILEQWIEEECETGAAKGSPQE